MSILEVSVEDVPFQSLSVDLAVVKQLLPLHFKRLNSYTNIWEERPKWTVALNKAQEAVKKAAANTSMAPFLNIKKDFPVAFINLPGGTNSMPRFNQINRLVQVRGNIVKARDAGMREVTREYKCNKCKKTMLIHANRSKRFLFESSPQCITKNCDGKVHDTADPDASEPNLTHYIDFQEIFIQTGNNTDLLTVELEQELTRSIALGSCVTIVGTYEPRCYDDEMDDISMVLRAVSICVNEKQQKLNTDPDELAMLVKMDWEQDLDRFNGNEMRLRDELVGSVAPELQGLSIIKLGLVLILCSGGQTDPEVSEKNPSSLQRDIAHFLMIGNPGLGKSQLLKAATKISTNAVSTVGYSTTTAGLTARCYREDGDMHIEAGSLVKANNGICCIDEINYMTKEHRSSIHEVMESQKITVTKGEKNLNLFRN